MTECGVERQRLSAQMAADLLCPAAGATLVFAQGELVAHRVSGEACDAVVAAILDRSEAPLERALKRRRAATRHVLTGCDRERRIAEWRLPMGEVSVWVVGEVDHAILETAASAIVLEQQRHRLQHPDLAAPGGQGNRRDLLGRRVIAARGGVNPVLLDLHRVALTAAHRRGLIVHEEGDQAFFVDEGSLLTDLRTINGLSIGVSARLVEGQTLHAARQQAEIALAAACQLELPVIDAGTLQGWLVCAEKVASDAIAASPLAAQDPLSDLEQDPALLTTLRANLSNPGRPKETSATLMLHVNSLRYRLRKAENILGISADDPRLRHALLVSELFTPRDAIQAGLPRSA